MTVGTEAVDRSALAAWLVGRRWFGSKSRELTEVELLDLPLLDGGPPQLRLALVEARFAAGAEEIYQLPIVLDGDGGREDSRIARFDAEGRYAFDALTDRHAAKRLLDLLVADEEIESDEGRVDFRWVGERLPAGAEARPISAEQSNSSVVFGENAILKAYRRLEPGVNPELEVLRFLGGRDFPQVPALLGWYEYGGREIGATLGVVQEFVADGRDGWELTLDRLSGDADSMLAPLRELGATVGALHSALAADPADPAFAPEERGEEAVARIAATVDDEIARLFAQLPGDERLAPIAGRAEDLRERVRGLAEVAGAGMAIRIHGDLHLGQVLRSDRGWTILDFEGEPARPLAERRAKHSPLRDVAGLLRSLAYAPAAARMQRGAAPPDDWEARARESLLGGYLEAISPTLLPSTRQGIDGLLALHELEKAVYELAYELGHRPDWVEIPVAGIIRLLEMKTA